MTCTTRFNTTNRLPSGFYLAKLSSCLVPCNNMLLMSSQPGSTGKSSTRQELVTLCGELQTTSPVTRRSIPQPRNFADHKNDPKSIKDPIRTRIPRTNATMASRILRPAFRNATRAPIVARSFQTSAALRQDAVVAPVRKPVGAFRGG